MQTPVRSAQQTARSRVPVDLRDIPKVTTGFERYLRGRVLVIADGENLSYGLRKQGYDCDFGALRSLLKNRHPKLEAHAFACVKGDEARRFAHEYFHREGWQAHIELAQTIKGYHGMQTKANSDNQILLGAAELITATRPDTLVLATGDGDLGCDIADFYSRRLKTGDVIICSTVGATSRRLFATGNENIRANVWLGWDCIVPAAH